MSAIAARFLQWPNGDDELVAGHEWLASGPWKKDPGHERDLPRLFVIARAFAPRVFAEIEGDEEAALAVLAAHRVAELVDARPAGLVLLLHRASGLIIQMVGPSRPCLPPLVSVPRPL
jgi:hypothetical protein